MVPEGRENAGFSDLANQWKAVGCRRSVAHPGLFSDKFQRRKNLANPLSQKLKRGR
jgi:hypothetical protein